MNIKIISKGAFNIYVFWDVTLNRRVVTVVSKESIALVEPRTPQEELLDSKYEGSSVFRNVGNYSANDRCENLQSRILPRLWSLK